jgi:PEP-CTERM motif
MFKRVVFAAMALVSVVSMPQYAQASIVVSAVETITGDTVSKTVTININVITADPLSVPVSPPLNNDLFEQIGYYNFRVNLTGPNISGLTAEYNTTSVFSPLTEFDFDIAPGVNPGITGTQISFRASSPSNIEVPTTGNNFIGSITFTTTLNGAFNFSITPLAVLAGPQTGFARNHPNPLILGLDQDLQPKVINVSGILGVPEPSSIALIGIALAGFGGIQMRRRLKALKA